MVFEYPLTQKGEYHEEQIAKQKYTLNSRSMEEIATQQDHSTVQFYTLTGKHTEVYGICKTPVIFPSILLTLQLPLMEMQFVEIPSTMNF